MNTYVECPNCGSAVDRSAWTCPSCGADVALMLEERRLARDYLRYLVAAIGGAVLLSAAITIPLGALSRHASHMLPMWIAFVAVGLALWLVADRFEPVAARAGKSDPRGGTH